MKSLLKQLESEESILLMYISGELSPHDSHEVEQMLSESPQMQRRLDELRGTISGVEMLFSEADEKQALDTDRAMHRAMEGIRQLHSASKIGKSIPPAPQRRLPLPWWMYPVAAAASILVAAAVFMANTDPEPLAPALFQREVLPQDIYIMASPVLDRQGITGLSDYHAATELIASFEGADAIDTDMHWVAMRRDLDALRAVPATLWAEGDVYW